METASGLITPVILCGGSNFGGVGSEEADKPRPFRKAVGNLSMFQQTLLRVSDPGRFNAPIIVGSEQHESFILSDADTVGVEPAAVVLEPVGRGTAPAMVMAALVAGALKLGDTLMVVPSTHLVRDPGTLIGAIDQAHVGARHGALLAFGIRPPSAEVDCTYLRKGPHLFADQHDEVGEAELHRVTEVHERPSQEAAGLFLSNEEFYWSSGMFLFPIAGLLGEVRVHAPELLAGCQQALLKGVSNAANIHPDAEALSACPAMSIEAAVMSKTNKGAIVPTGSLWADIGSWKALWQTTEREASIGAIVSAASGSHEATVPELPTTVEMELPVADPVEQLETAPAEEVLTDPAPSENPLAAIGPVEEPAPVEEPQVMTAVETVMEPAVQTDEERVERAENEASEFVNEGEEVPKLAPTQRARRRKGEPGTVLKYEASNIQVNSVSPLTAVLGLDDVVVVNTGDAVIVASQKCADKIHEIAKSMQKDVVAGWEGAVLLPEAAVEMIAEAADEFETDSSNISGQSEVSEAA